MIGLSMPGRIFIATAPVDMRKAHDGLCAVVRDCFHEDPFSGDVFVFLNRRRDRVKLLVWDKGGFWLLYKRLEKGRFEAIRASTAGSPSAPLDRAQLAMLLDGFEIKSARKRKHFGREIRLEPRTRLGSRQVARA